MAGFNQSNINISSQFGMPLFGVAGVLPFTGNFYWVDETNGSDGNTGGPQDPLATLTQAHSLCLANNNDVVFLTGTVHTTATTTWSKNRTHLIGLAPTLRGNARSRISQTGSTLFTPLVSVTAAECIFLNIGAFHGFANASSQICWADAGQRNYYKNCAFLGMGNATAAAQAGGRSLVVGSGGNGEHNFVECQIGLDTVTRSAANASLELTGATPRNVFSRCIFPCLTSSATALFIKTAAAAALDRDQVFEDCSFVNQIQSTSTTMTVAISMAASAGGLLELKSCTLIGATKWGDTAALAQTYVDGGPPTAATTGLAVNPS